MSLMALGGGHGRGELALMTGAAGSAWLTIVVLRLLAAFRTVDRGSADALGLGIDLRLDFAAIAAAALFNLLTTRSGRQPPASETEATASVGFDLCQLGALLYLMGGLDTPSALLLLAPVTISASVPSLRATVLLGILASAITTGLVLLHTPRRLATARCEASGASGQPAAASSGT